jgi:hypothetical protein
VPVTRQPGPDPERLCWLWNGETVGLGWYRDGRYVVLFPHKPGCRFAGGVTAWAPLTPPAAPT